MNIVRSFNYNNLCAICTIRKSCRFLWNLPTKLDLNVDYYCDKNNFHEIETNINRRKSSVDIKLVHELKSKLDQLDPNGTDYKKCYSELTSVLLKMPNKTHPNVDNDSIEPKIIKTVGKKREFAKVAYTMNRLTRYLKVMLTTRLSTLIGERPYMFLGDLAELEQILIKYVVRRLLKLDFKMLSVPDILHENIIRNCGMETVDQRNQVFHLDPELHGEHLCLSGTAEMSIAAFLMNKVLDEDSLPLKYVAVSRCYRGEVSNLKSEKGVYRVHEFNKVEMFMVTKPQQSADALEEIRAIQESIFSDLELHFQVLDMPAHELGAQAYRKYDIEAWMYGRDMFGEISSCSNCTDFQSRRLAIQVQGKENLYYPHTLNGTACAIPRLLMAIVEGNQNPDKTIIVPKVLQPLWNNKTHICMQTSVPIPVVAPHGL